MRRLFRKYWYVILIVIIILCLAVLVEVFRVAVYFADTPFKSFADHTFNFLSGWAVAGGPVMTLIAVAVALYIGIKSLRQTENIQKREQKHRLLNETNNWAEEAIELVDRFQRGFKDPDMFDRKLILRAKTMGIESVLSKFSISLSHVVMKAIRDFEAFDNEFKKEHWDLKDKSEQCKDSLKALIEYVSALKAEDIG